MYTQMREQTTIIVMGGKRVNCSQYGLGSFLRSFPHTQKFDTIFNLNPNTLRMGKKTVMYEILANECNGMRKTSKTSVVMFQWLQTIEKLRYREWKMKISTILHIKNSKLEAYS